MPTDALVNTGAPDAVTPTGPRSRVSEMQTKLHRWVAADPGRRFDDLFNFVYDPATLVVASTGSRATPVPIPPVSTA
jgi:RNA-directed DNA polymerase